MSLILHLETATTVCSVALSYEGKLIALKEGSPEYGKVAGKIFQWSITYLSLLSVVLVAAQLLS